MLRKTASYSIRTVLVIAALTGGGCASDDSSTAIMREQISLRNSDLKLSSLIVLPGNRVGAILESNADGTDLTRQDTPKVFQAIAFHDLSINPVPVQVRRECVGRWLLYSYGMLPDGRLGFTAICKAVGISDTYALAYDTTTGETSELLAYGVPGAIAFSWNPRLDRAIARFGTLYSGVHWANPSGMEPVQAALSRNGKTVSLAQGYLESKGIHAHSTGNVDYPAWSPDGLSVAMVASFDSIGITGTDRVAGEWVLMLMNAQTLNLTILEDGIYWPHIVRWTNDGRNLVYSAKRSMGVQGIWLFSMSEQTSSLIAEGRFRDILVGPTSRDVYAIRCIGANDSCDQQDVWRYELPTTVP